MQLLFSLSIAVLCAACGAASSEATPMSTDPTNTQLVRRLFLECFNGNRKDLLPELLSPDFTGAGPERGPAAFAGVIDRLHTAFPDIVYTIEDVVAAGDRVAVRWTWRGTHTGQFRTYAISNKPVVNAGVGIFQVAGGKLTRAWLETDRLGFLLAIGAIPYDPAYGPPPPR
jgi:predicted ester cyclase